MTSLAMAASAWAQDTDDTAIEAPAPPPKDCPVPDRVRVGAYVNSLSELDIERRTVEFDGYLWFKWCNPALVPGETLDLLNASDPATMTITASYPAPVELDDGVLYQLIRVRGRVSTPLPLRDYPFDRQLIGLVFEDDVHNVASLVYELDPDGASINPKLGLPGYIAGAARIDIAEEPYPTRFGDTRADQGPVYSRASVRVPLARPLFSQALAELSPVALIAACVGIAFARHGSVPSRAVAGTVAMLALIALGIVRSGLPAVETLTAIDELIVATGLYVVTGLGIVVRSAALSDSNRDADGESLHRLGLTAATSVYILACSVLIGLAIITG